MHVLLLREARGAKDPYHNVLSEIGAISSIPVLSIKIFDYSSIEKELRDSESYDSVVFTSANAVKAFKKFSQYNESFDVENFTKKACFVVGKATEKSAKELGFQCSGSSSGNAEELAEFLIREKCGKPLKTVLFPCGQMKREILPQLLSKANIPLQCLTVYETTEHPDIFNSIKNYREETLGSVAVVFFSPSGVNFVLPKIKEVYADAFASLYLCAIGKTTAEAMDAIGHPVDAISESPSPEGLLNTLRSSFAQSAS